MLEAESANIYPNKTVVSEYIIQKEKSDSMIYGVMYSPPW